MLKINSFISSDADKDVLSSGKTGSLSTLIKSFVLGCFSKSQFGDSNSNSDSISSRYLTES